MQPFLLRNASWGVLGHLADRGATVVATMLLASALTPAAFASYGFFQLTITTLSSVSALGVGVAGSRLFAQWRNADTNAAQWIAPLWLACILVGLLIAVASVSTAALWHPSPQDLHAPLQVAGVLAVVIGVVAQGGLLGLALFKQAAWVSMAAGTVTLLLGINAALLRSPAWAQFSLVASAAVSTALACGVVFHHLPPPGRLPPANLSPARLVQLSHLIGPLAFVTLLAASGNWLLGRMLLTGSSADPSDFAAFAIGLQWYGMVQLIPGMVTKAAFPSLVGSGDVTAALATERRQVLRRSVVGSVMAAVAMVIAVALFSPLLHQLYGGSAISPPLLILFALAAVPGSFANALGNALVAADMAKDWLRWTVLWVLMLLGMSWTLRDMGAAGSAWSLFVAGASLSAGAWWTAKRTDLI